MEDYLSSLNESQREAVLDFEHSLLVLAGAGSGKTRVITTKIVHAMGVLGYKGWQILAVTFTNKAANEMRSRVESMLPEGFDMSGLEIKTFHSYGAGLLRKNAGLLGYSSSFSIYDDSDSINLLQQIYPSESKSELKETARLISRAKDFGLTTDDNLEYYEKQRHGFRIRYREYEKRLKDCQCFDFADLILKSNELLESEKEVKQRLNNRYRLILVDEYQDSNGSQFQFLKNLVGPTTQLMVVGDDDQSIYRFRGARIENILNFDKDYPNVRTIKLEENYRSTKSIINLAANLISKNHTRHDKTMFTNNEEGEKPKVLNFYDEEEECEGIVSRICDILGEGSIAILYRTNAQSRGYEQALTKMRIKYQVVGALRFYEREEVKDMLAIFSILINPHDQISFTRIVNKPPRGIGKVAVQKILEGGDNIIHSIESILTANLAKSSTKGGLITFMRAYNNAKKRLDEGVPLSEMATEAMKDFGLYEHYMGERDQNVRESRMQNLNALVGALSGYEPSINGLASFLETITLDNSAIPGEDNRINPDVNVVKLITMHNTKGLEFDTVFVTGLADDIIPGTRHDENINDIEEERRIFYVALTRARRHLYLSWARVRKLWGQTQYNYPSRFFNDIPDELYDGSIASVRQVTQSSSTYINKYSFSTRIRPQVAERADEFPQPQTKPVVKVVKAENKEVFKAGDSVYSPDYGNGVVQAADEKNGRTIIRVAYDNGRKAIYNAKFCNLKKL